MLFTPLRVGPKGFILCVERFGRNITELIIKEVEYCFILGSNRVFHAIEMYKP
jgi:hypothetical protein